MLIVFLLPVTEHQREQLDRDFDTASEDFRVLWQAFWLALTVNPMHLELSGEKTLNFETT